MIRGGKLRQCIAMIEGQRVSRLLSACSIHSPQSAIVAYAAQRLGISCTIFVGGKSDTLPLRIATDFGANIVRCSSGRHTVLFSALRRQLIQGDLAVPFGMRPNWPCPSFYRTCALQVQNLPSQIDTIVVVAGSGVTGTIITYGLWLHRPTISKIVLLGVGPDRQREILKVLQVLDKHCVDWLVSKNIFQHCSLSKEPRFRYESPVPFRIGQVILHPLYEGKAFEWFMRNVSFARAHTLFWVTGPPLERSSPGRT